MNQQMTNQNFARLTANEYRNEQAHAELLNASVATWYDERVDFGLVKGSLALGTALSTFAQNMKENAELVDAGRFDVVHDILMEREKVTLALRRFKAESGGIFPDVAAKTIEQIELSFGEDLDIPAFPDAPNASDSIGRIPAKKPFIVETLSQMLLRLRMTPNGQAENTDTLEEDATITPADGYTGRSQIVPDVVGMLDAMVHTQGPVLDVFNRMTLDIVHARELITTFKRDNTPTIDALAKRLENAYAKMQMNESLSGNAIDTYEPFKEQAEDLAQVYSDIVDEVRDVMLNGERKIEADKSVTVTSADKTRTYNFTLEQLEKIKTSNNTLDQTYDLYEDLENAVFADNDTVTSVTEYLVDRSLIKAASLKESIDQDYALNPVEINDAWKALNLSRTEMGYLACSFLAIGKHPNTEMRNKLSVATLEAVMAGNFDRDPRNQNDYEKITTQLEFLEYVQANKDQLTMASLLDLGQVAYNNEQIMWPDTPVSEYDLQLSAAIVAALSGLSFDEEPAQEAAAPAPQGDPAQDLDALAEAAPLPAAEVLEESAAPAPEQDSAQDLSAAREQLVASVTSFVDASQVMIDGMEDADKAAFLTEKLNYAAELQHHLNDRLTNKVRTLTDLNQLTTIRRIMDRVIVGTFNSVVTESLALTGKTRDVMRRQVLGNVGIAYDAVRADMHRYTQLQNFENPILSEQVVALQPDLVTALEKLTKDTITPEYAQTVAENITDEIFANTNAVLIMKALQLAESGSPIADYAARTTRDKLLKAADLITFYKDQPRKAKKLSGAFADQDAAMDELAEIGAKALGEDFVPPAAIPTAPARPSLLSRMLGTLKAKQPAEPRAKVEPKLSGQPLVLPDNEPTFAPLGDIRQGDDAVGMPLGDLRIEPTLLDEPRISSAPFGIDLPAFSKPEDRRVEDERIEPTGEPASDQADELTLSDYYKSEVGGKIRPSKVAIVLGAGAKALTGAGDASLATLKFARGAVRQLARRSVVIGVGAGVGWSARMGTGLLAGAAIINAPTAATLGIVGVGAVVVGAGVGAFTARLNTIFDEQSAQGKNGMRAGLSATGQTLREIGNGQFFHHTLKNLGELPALLGEAGKAVRARDAEGEKSGLKRAWNASTRYLRIFGEANRINPVVLRTSLNMVLGGLGSGIGFVLTHMNVTDAVTLHQGADTVAKPVTAPVIDRTLKGDGLVPNTDTPVVTAPATVTDPTTVVTPPVNDTLTSVAPVPQHDAVTSTAPVVTPQTDTVPSDASVMTPKVVQTQRITVPAYDTGTTTPSVTPQSATVTSQAPVSTPVTAPIATPTVADTIAAATSDAGKIRALMQLPEMKAALAELSPAQQKHFAGLINAATNRGSLTSLNDLIDNISEGGRFHGNTLTHLRGLRPDHAHAITLRQLVQDKLNGVTFENKGFGHALDLNNDHLLSLQGQPSKVGSWVSTHPRTAAPTVIPRATVPATTAPVSGDSIPNGQDPIGDLIKTLPADDAVAPVPAENPISSTLNSIGDRVKHLFGGASTHDTSVQVTELPPVHTAWTSDISKTLGHRFVGRSGMSQDQFETLLSGVDSKNPGALRALKSWSRTFVNEPNLTVHEKELMAQIRRMAVPSTAPKAKI